MTLRKLPDTVYLPTSTVLKPAEVRKACGGVSRAALLSWRSRRGFPNFYGLNSQSFYMAEEVAAWLIQQGRTVRWV